jgi:hypothetical protein
MPNTGISYRPVLADFLTPSYRIVGTTLVPPSGLIGTMNDINTSFVEIQNAQLARLHEPNYIVDRYQMLRLVKDHVVAVCAARRDDLGSGAMARSSLGQVIEYRVFISSRDYEFEGSLEWAGRFNIGSILAEAKKQFVPLFRVTINPVLFPDITINSPAVLINGSHYDLFALAAQRKEVES